jgi:hypothetical protein
MVDYVAKIKIKKNSTIFFFRALSETYNNKPETRIPKLETIFKFSINKIQKHGSAKVLSILILIFEPARLCYSGGFVSHFDIQILDLNKSRFFNVPFIYQISIVNEIHF